MARNLRKKQIITEQVTEPLLNMQMQNVLQEKMQQPEKLQRLQKNLLQRQIKLEMLRKNWGQRPKSYTDRIYGNQQGKQ